MGLPMMPRPMNPILLDTLTLLFSCSAAARLDRAADARKNEALILTDRDGPSFVERRRRQGLNPIFPVTSDGVERREFTKVGMNACGGANAAALARRLRTPAGS